MIFFEIEISCIFRGQTWHRQKLNHCTCFTFSSDQSEIAFFSRYAQKSLKSWLNSTLKTTENRTPKNPQYQPHQLISFRSICLRISLKWNFSKCACLCARTYKVTLKAQNFENENIDFETENIDFKLKNTVFDYRNSKSKTWKFKILRLRWPCTLVRPLGHFL